MEKYIENFQLKSKYKKSLKTDILIQNFFVSLLLIHFTIFNTRIGLCHKTLYVEYYPKNYNTGNQISKKSSLVFKKKSRYEIFMHYHVLLLFVL